MIDNNTTSVAAAFEMLIEEIEADIDFVNQLASDPNLPRWRNAARWARNAMAREGLLKNDSPRGTWEISESGKQYLAET